MVFVPVIAQQNQDFPPPKYASYLPTYVYPNAILDLHVFRQPYGVNYPGATFKFTVLDTSGVKRVHQGIYFTDVRKCNIGH